MYCYHCMSQMQSQSRICPVCGRPAYTAVEAHHLSPGTVLSKKYVVGKVLGEGGFGITYVGRDVNLDMKVAIKEYYPSGYANRDHSVTNQVSIASRATNDYYAKGKERFLQEARILAKFSHDPNVVNVRDYFQENDTAYIVMEYLEGPNLKDYLKEHGKQAPAQLVEWFLPILRVLGKIHGAGLIHRDISPDNIIVEDGNLILIDFGAAREVEANKSLSVVLKPGYAPGEQYYTHGNQGPWTDVYAICATMYRCITGVVPPESSERLFEDKLVPPSQLGIEIPKHIERALMKGLSNRYQDRQPNMETLITELTTALPDEESLTQESQEDLDDLPMTVHIDNRDAAEYPKEEEATQPQPSEEPQTSLETEPVPEPKPVPKSEPVPEPKPVPKQEEAARPEKEQERDAKKEKGKRGKILPIAVIGAVAVIILVIILCVAGKGNKSKTPDTPTMKQVMNDVIADDAISDTILEFEVVESKLNQQGTTYTVNCSAKTEKEEYTVIVIYELEDDDWVYSQNIVKSSE